jgi:hypothetical protein
VRRCRPRRRPHAACLRGARADHGIPCRALHRPRGGAVGHRSCDRCDRFSLGRARRAPGDRGAERGRRALREAPRCGGARGGGAARRCVGGLVPRGRAPPGGELSVAVRPARVRGARSPVPGRARTGGDAAVAFGHGPGDARGQRVASGERAAGTDAVCRGAASHRDRGRRAGGWRGRRSLHRGARGRALGRSVRAPAGSRPAPPRVAGDRRFPCRPRDRFLDLRDAPPCPRRARGAAPRSAPSPRVWFRRRSPSTRP